ncbi:MAG: hypothetical protein NTX27_10410 [Verrucomicrobia bacterium]|nr:hypothetical protein [Verrucomicrobiota bacterium]
MKIAILGWGSLIWDKRQLAISGEWQPGGPVLKIEFSRISKDGRLTLVIDEQNGTGTATLSARSEFTHLNDAIANLREREKTSAEKIGYVNLISRTERDYSRQHHPAACDAITFWAQANCWDAVIWTALISNFEQERHQPFSVPAAVAYVASLAGESSALALEYLRRAPAVVDTPVRRQLSTRTTGGVP